MNPPPAVWSITSFDVSPKYQLSRIRKRQLTNKVFPKPGQFARMLGYKNDKLIKSPTRIKKLVNDIRIKITPRKSFKANYDIVASASVKRGDSSEGNIWMIVFQKLKDDSEGINAGFFYDSRNLKPCEGQI